MNRIAELIIKQVEFIPQEPEEGILYVSKSFGVAIHNCACGCGIKTVMPFKQVPIAPDDHNWGYQEHEDGTVSFDPSIGNFKWEPSYHAHYYIKKNKINWTP